MVSTTAPVVTRPATQRTFWQRFRAGDEIAIAITWACASAVLLITCLVVWELWTNSSIPRAKFGWGFLTATIWDPNLENFGALPFVFGTLVTSAIALLIAVPLGVGAAVFLSELAPPKLSDTLTFLIELLAAVPSVIYGLLGLFILVPILRTNIYPIIEKTVGYLPLFKGPFFGVSVLTAGLVLSIMIVPFIVSVSREVLLSVPMDQREAALALGATRWETTSQIVVPYAATGIIGSIFLALARSLGETMAVTMVIGNSPKIAASLLAPGYSIAAVIANQFNEASEGMYMETLILLGLVLFALTMLINAIARILVLGATSPGK